MVADLLDLWEGIHITMSMRDGGTMSDSMSEKKSDHNRACLEWCEVRSGRTLAKDLTMPR